jgi:acyl-CoA thioesterase FadM
VGQVAHVCVDVATFRPTPLPEEFRAGIRNAVEQAEAKA